ncbi:MAG: nickel pincer cofactor biosynthesis protein LarB [Butyrivibrio sp.]|nr:nickel pincer cofactor biosynthesis protein LarB [Butyrivibrio sp.]
MDENSTLRLLEAVKDGSLPIDKALLELRKAPFEDLGFVKPDYHRGLRQGKSEVIYGQGKTKEQILKISEKFLEHGQDKVLITRMSSEAADYYRSEKTSFTEELFYDSLSRVGIAYGNGVSRDNADDGAGTIVVATGGTSDMPVAEEAALTAEFYGNKVERLYDVGVAGIHRLMNKGVLDKIMTAGVIIAIAGMEGALASVIGGLADCPVIAVPTSVGYGASFGGLSALLSMLNSCASGVSVVNIDNGFGAGYLASMINRK